MKPSPDCTRFYKKIVIHNSARNINQVINLKILHGVYKCNEKFIAEKVWIKADDECDGCFSSCALYRTVTVKSLIVMMA
jgi:hypothetical protein